MTMQGFLQYQSTCRKCQGAGTIITNPCKPCHGRGTQSKEQLVDVPIPAGIEDRMELRVNGTVVCVCVCFRVCACMCSTYSRSSLVHCVVVLCSGCGRIVYLCWQCLWTNYPGLACTLPQLDRVALLVRVCMGVELHVAVFVGSSAILLWQCQMVTMGQNYIEQTLIPCYWGCFAPHCRWGNFVPQERARLVRRAVPRGICLYTCVWWTVPTLSVTAPTCTASWTSGATVVGTGILLCIFLWYGVFLCMFTRHMVLLGEFQLVLEAPCLCLWSTACVWTMVVS